MKDDLTKIEKAVTDMKDLYTNYIKRNGSSSLRISNKEINLWIVKTLLQQEKTIVELKTRQGLLYLLVTGLIIKVIIF